MKKLFSAILAIVILQMGIIAQTKEPVKDDANGFSFNVPANWSNQQLSGGSVLVNPEKTASIIVKTHRYNDLNSMLKAQGGIEQDGFKLLGEIASFGDNGKFFRAYKEANNQQLIIDTFFLVSEYGGGVIILAASTDVKSAETAFKGAAELIKTLNFYRPKQAAQNSNLKNLFANKKLSYFYRGNGYSESRKIWLCSSGTYLSRSESFSNSQLGTGSTASSSEGTWQVKQSGGSVYLILQSNEGGVGEYEVSAREASNEIGLNGKRFFVEDYDECN